MLTDEYVAEAVRDARRFQGQWSGTSGTLAAHTYRLAKEREELLEMITSMGDGTSVMSEAAMNAWEAVKRRHQETLDRCKSPPAAESPAVGTTAKFGTGAVRSDAVEEFRYDLVSPIGLREVARACAEGAEKYGDWNWEKGMPVHDLLNHAIAHIYTFLAGDRSEPHLGHAAWNLLAAIHSDELWHDINAGTLRGDGCKAPE